MAPYDVGDTVYCVDLDMRRHKSITEEPYRVMCLRGRVVSAGETTIAVMLRQPDRISFFDRGDVYTHDDEALLRADKLAAEHAIPVVKL